MVDMLEGEADEAGAVRCKRTNAFRSAAQIIQPRWLFRKALIAYADRKIVILGWLHLVASLTIYGAYLGLY